MSLERTEVEDRLAELPAPLRKLYDNNTVVNNIWKLYAHGGIITREEAFLQMIVLLGSDYDNLFKKHVEAVRNLPIDYRQSEEAGK